MHEVILTLDNGQKISYVAKSVQVRDIPDPHVQVRFINAIETLRTLYSVDVPSKAYTFRDDFNCEVGDLVKVDTSYGVQKGIVVGLGRNGFSGNVTKGVLAKF